MTKILAIDAAQYFGWAYGVAGQPPESGSRYFAKSGQGASRGAVFSGAMRFVAEMITKHGNDISIMIEAPLAASLVQGTTNKNTTEVLMGLPAVIEGMAHTMGCFHVERCVLSSIRKHFISKGNMKGDQAKPLIMKKCIALGWVKMGDDDMSHDRSDALALWSYAEHQIAPKISQPIDDLFIKSGGRIQ